MDIQCMHAIVHGRVQGVFFRDYTRQEAEKLSLGGWVRNLPEGTVETVFQGAPEDVDRFLSWLSVGSPMSEVTKVDSRMEAVDSTRKYFKIRY